MDVTTAPNGISTEGWDIGRAEELDWIPWGAGGARAKILGTADGYVVALVEADAGYEGIPHQHDHAEFFFLVDGEITNQGVAMNPGDGYAAAAGSRHDQFRAETTARYVSIFKL